MGANVVVKKRNFTEPVRCIKQDKQSLITRLCHPRDADRALNHAKKAIGCISSTKKKLTCCQFSGFQMRRQPRFKFEGKGLHPDIPESHGNRNGSIGNRRHGKKDLCRLPDIVLSWKSSKLIGFHLRVFNMKTLEQHLSQYAAYHRDSRNIVTHFIGIPLIVAALITLLSRPAIEIDGWIFSPAMLLSAMMAIYYLYLDRPLGALMAVLLALGVWFGSWVAAKSTPAWLFLGAGGFVVGWVFQFIGHALEGRKPAFLDDMAGLIIGPIFVVAEAVFWMGLRSDLKHAVEANAGTIRHGQIFNI